MNGIFRPRKGRWMAGSVRRVGGGSVMSWLVGLAVLVALAHTATVLWAGVAGDHRVEVVARKLFADLLLARAWSVEQRQRVVVCAGSWRNGACEGRSWSAGWSVWLVPSSTRGTVPRVLSGFDQVLPPVAVRAASQPVRDYVSFDPDGVARMASGAFQAGSLVVCRTDRPGRGIRLVINAAGRIRWEDRRNVTCDDLVF